MGQHMRRTTNREKPREQHRRRTANREKPREQHRRRTTNREKPREQHRRRTANMENREKSWRENPRANLLHKVTFFIINELDKKHQQDLHNDQATSSPEKHQMLKPRAIRTKLKAASRGKLYNHLACIRWL
ncbi:hypothetical protein M5K25_014039 [Dendrobium thyrsiflorum]|uniref:Uncharacterized protein n=1 Tax=Dendrobium thyrsiflorum TaxID=117978 RepID=A0ABD0UUE7_DENTH